MVTQMVVSATNYIPSFAGYIVAILTYKNNNHIHSKVEGSRMSGTENVFKAGIVSFMKNNKSKRNS